MACANTLDQTVAQLCLGVAKQEGVGKCLSFPTELFIK